MKFNLSIVSIAISILVIIGIIYHNVQLAALYQDADQKTKALFGIIELAHLNTKLYLGYCIIFTLMLEFIAWRRKEAKKYYLSAIGMSFLTIILLFIRLWTFYGITTSTTFNRQ